jgi:hypothetical protein
MTAAAAPAIAQLFKLDFGCGKNKQPGFHGVDRIAFDGVDTVLNVVEPRFPHTASGFCPWPWADSSVDEAYSSHFVEHLTSAERCHFFNELWRVLKPDAKATIITPHWSNARAYGDPTHVWPPISEWFYLYLNKAWREVNAPHVDMVSIGNLHLTQAAYSCNFEGGCVTTVNTQHPELMGKNVEAQNYATRNFINVNVDAYATLVAKK